MENYKIYAHINKNNGKTYVGQTKQTLSRRWRKNGEGYKNNKNFYKAIQEEGWDNFKHILLFENLSLEQANLIEKFLIKKFDLQNENKGYNIANGGNGFPTSSSEILSKKNKEKWQAGKYNKIKNEVFCIELNRKFESALEAERQTGIDNSSIQKTCKNINKYSGFSPKGEPLHWCFIEDLTEEKIKNLYFKPETIKGVSIPIYCPELNEYLSSSEEGIKYNIDPSQIRKAARGTAKSAGKHPITKEKLHWILKPELIKSKNKISKEIWNKLFIPNIEGVK